MPIKRILTIFILTCSSTLSAQQLYEMIEQDYAANLISHTEYVVNRAYAAFAPEKLNPRYRIITDSREQIRCATQIIAEIKQNYSLFSIEDRDFFAQFINRPALPLSYVSPSGYFKIHYTTDPLNESCVPPEDSNVNGLPDWIESAGEIFDQVYYVEIDLLGYKVPYSDGSEYDIYMKKMPPGYYGYVDDEYDDPSTSWYDPSSYMVISNDFQDSELYTNGIDGLKVTAAHEFHHAIQMGYTWKRTDFWLYEWTSTWFEDIVYPEINDYYQYLSTTFQNLDKPITSTSPDFLKYGNCIFFHYLTKSYSNDIVRKIWEQYFLNSGIVTLRNVIKNETGLSFEEILHEFYTWNYFTGSRADTVNYYTDGKHFPEVKYQENIVAENDTSFSIVNPRMSASYLRVTRQQATKFVAEIVTDQYSIGAWQAGLFVTGDITGPQYEPIRFSGISGSGTITSLGAGPELVIVASAVSESYSGSSSGRYTMDIDLKFEGPEQINANRLEPTWPSPANFNAVEEVTIPFILTRESNIDLRIYTVSGRLVKSFPMNHYNSGFHTSIQWDGFDNAGKRVPSGVYLYVLKGEGFSDVKKLAVIR